jgi:hypothetical protein
VATPGKSFVWLCSYHIPPIEEARSVVLASGRLSAKVLSERYAHKHGE